MKVLIRETLKTIGVNIYGTDGKLHTKEFFEKYFSDVEGAYPTPVSYTHLTLPTIA